MSFNVISTFSGCGGSSLGYKMAGGDVRLAVEWDDNAVETYRLNFPSTPIYHGDIAQLSVEHALELSGLNAGELDVLDGSPPCQGFSSSGKRRFHDSRNQLFREYVRLLRGLQPKVMVMENVKGMVTGKMRLIFVECLKELKSCGYNVKTKLLNAKYFNVPQSRQRLIFIGTRNDLGIEPSFPLPQGMPLTVRDALAEPIIGDDVFPVLKGKFPDMMKLVKPGQSCQEAFGQGFSYKKLAWHKPSNTIPKSPSYAGACLFLPTGEPPSGRQLMRLASYPDDFRFVGGYQEWHERIGNSVPPKFMQAIAEHIDANVLRSLRKD